MRTNAVFRSVDSETYQALIEQRLDRLDSYYERLSLQPGSNKSEAVAKAIRLHHMLKTVHEKQGTEQDEEDESKECCLFLPNPTMRRNVPGCEIFNEDDGVKLMRLTAIKRVYPITRSDVNQMSLPYGWKE